MEIKNSKIEINPKDYSKIFGDWIKNPEILQEKFKNAKPYPNIVIENFLNEDFAKVIKETFPEINEHFHKYNNPIEVKYSMDDISVMPNEHRILYDALADPEVINKFSLLTGIPNLLNDIYRHGAGDVHMPNNGRLGKILNLITNIMKEFI